MHTGIYIVLFLIGFVALYLGAEGLVRGSSSIARALGIKPVIIGLTIIAFGTSAPEFFVSFVAALHGVTDIAVGNVVGSNISNIGLVLGISAMLVPTALSAKTLRPVSIELIISIFASLMFLAMAFNRVIGRVDGIILLAGIICFTVYCVMRANRKSEKSDGVKEYTEEAAPGFFIPLTIVSAIALAAMLALCRDISMSSVERLVLFPAMLIFASYCAWEISWNAKAGENTRVHIPRAASAAFTLAGLVMLIIGARLMTDSAVAIAQRMGVSELAIGLTVVALGTSLPEMAASVVSVMRGEAEMCVGNIMGSNIFNLFLVIGGSAIVCPLPIDAGTLHYQVPIMIAFSLALVPSLFILQKSGRIVGSVLIAGYLAFIAFAFIAS